MRKNYMNINEERSRKIFVIGPDGKLFDDIEYHGQILYKPGYEKEKSIILKKMEDRVLDSGFTQESLLLYAVGGGFDYLYKDMAQLKFIRGGNMGGNPWISFHYQPTDEQIESLLLHFKYSNYTSVDLEKKPLDVGNGKWVNISKGDFLRNIYNFDSLINGKYEKSESKNMGLNEVNQRNIFVIGPEGKISDDFLYHGQVIFKPEYKKYKDEILDEYDDNIVELDRDIADGDDRIYSCMADRGFIRGGGFNTMWLSFSKQPTDSQVESILIKLKEKRDEYINIELVDTVLQKTGSYIKVNVDDFKNNIYDLVPLVAKYKHRQKFEIKRNILISIIREEIQKILYETSYKVGTMDSVVITPDAKIINNEDSCHGEALHYYPEIYEKALQLFGNNERAFRNAVTSGLDKLYYFMHEYNFIRSGKIIGGETMYFSFKNQPTDTQIDEFFKLIKANNIKYIQLEIYETPTRTIRKMVETPTFLEHAYDIVDYVRKSQNDDIGSVGYFREVQITPSELRKITREELIVALK